MKTEPHVVWKGLDASPALAERIHHELLQLEHTYDRITSCRVVVERPHHSYHVKIEVNVPGKVLSVTRDPAAADAANDVYATVNEAFGNMRRQLHDYIHVKRGA